MCNLGVISQERLRVEVRLLLSANRKSYMPRRLAQQRMTLSDLEWRFHALRAISAVAELLDDTLHKLKLQLFRFVVENSTNPQQSTTNPQPIEQVAFGL